MSPSVFLSSTDLKQYTLGFNAVKLCITTSFNSSLNLLMSFYFHYLDCIYPRSNQNVFFIILYLLINIIVLYIKHKAVGVPVNQFLIMKMFCIKFIMKSYHMKFAQINIDVPNVQDILFAHVIVSNFLRDRKYSWATEVPDQWVSGAAARVYCRCDQAGEVGTHPTRISLFCRRAQEPADSLSLFLLAGVFLAGWSVVLAGWCLF